MLYAGHTVSQRKQKVTETNDGKFRFAIDYVRVNAVVHAGLPNPIYHISASSTRKRTHHSMVVYSSIVYG